MSDENQHWVPQLILRKFVDRDGRVYCLDIHTDRVTKQPPKHAASEPGFNNFEVEGRILSFEDKFEKLETKAAPIFKRIVATHSLADLSPIDRYTVARFVAAQSFRTKAFYEGLKDKPSRAEFGVTFQTMWYSSHVTAMQIASRHWALMVIEHDDNFYLGDNPVVLQRTQDMRNGSNLGFDVAGVEAFLPLSPKCALYMACPLISCAIIADYESAMALHRAVRFAAFAGAKDSSAALLNAQTVIRRTHSIYEAFVQGEPLTAEPANVENLNYLQCSWAFGHMYSNQKDFVFARHVFRKTPQYRNVVRTSLLERGRIFVPNEECKGASQP